MTDSQLMFLLGLTLLYMLPWIVSLLRRHEQRLAIFVLNLFFGWTFLGWGIALVWACTNTRVREVR